jgi:hypothetical protein
MNTPVGFKAPNTILGCDSLNIDRLHPFGCLVWYKVPEANRKKLDPKGRQSILLSYLSDGNGFRLWDLQSKSVVKSRDVLFSDTIFPYSNTLATATFDKPSPVMVELPWLERNPVSSTEDPVSLTEIHV